MLGPGEHTIELFDDGVLFASRTFTVVTLGEEFLTGVSGESMAIDFPGPGQATLLEWNEAAQRFEIVGVVAE